MEESTFDIYAGTPGGNAKWLGSAPDLTGAQKRMEEFAAKAPGQYFIFSVWTSCVLSQLNTQKPLSAPKRKFAHAA
jgi:hypothetical protein